MTYRLELSGTVAKQAVTTDPGQTVATHAEPLTGVAPPARPGLCDPFDPDHSGAAAVPEARS